MLGLPISTPFPSCSDVSLGIGWLLKQLISASGLFQNMDPSLLRIEMLVGKERGSESSSPGFRSCFCVSGAC